MIYQKSNNPFFSFDSITLKLLSICEYIGVSKQLSIFNQAYMHIAKNK